MKFERGSAAEAYSYIDAKILNSNFFQRGLRVDGRQFDESRPVMITTGDLHSCEGSATVRIGNTKVMCGITAHLCKPLLQYPDCGIVQVNTQTTFSHPFQRNQRKNAAFYSDTIRELLLSSSASQSTTAGNDVMEMETSDSTSKTEPENKPFLDFKKLCVRPNLLCWVLYVDLVAIDNSGSLLDAFVTAAVAALADVKLPTIVLNEDGNIEPVDAQTLHPLSLGSAAPLVTSFGVTFCDVTVKNDGSRQNSNSNPNKFNRDDVIMLTDPTLEEEMGVCDVGGVISVTVVGEKDCNVSRAAGVPLSPIVISQCCQSARKRALAIKKLLPSTIQTS